jgi:hypothetical protein
MGGMQKRIADLFDKLGETFLINGTTPASGFFQQLDQARMSMYFDVIEQSSIVRPALVLLVSGLVAVNVGDTVTRDGRMYTLSKMAKIRKKDDVVLQVLVLT